MKVVMADTGSRVYNAAYATAVGMSAAEGDGGDGGAGGGRGSRRSHGHGAGRGRGGRGRGGRGRGGRGASGGTAEDGAEGGRRVKPRLEVATAGDDDDDFGQLSIDGDDEVWDPLAEDDEDETQSWPL